MWLSFVILPVLDVFQGLGDVAAGLLAVGLQKSEEVLGDVLDPAELLLTLVDVHLDSLQERGGRKISLKIRVARMRADSFRKHTGR